MEWAILNKEKERMARNVEEACKPIKVKYRSEAEFIDEKGDGTFLNRPIWVQGKGMYQPASS